MATDIEYLQQWVGKTETVQDILTLYPMQALAATLEHPGGSDKFCQDANVPPLWHWMYFLDTAKQSMLAEDGHPKKGDFLPPIGLPRRMWAGSRFQFTHPLKAGEVARKTSTIKSINVKQGKSGELAFVCVSHEVAGQNGLAFSEEHDIVYRDNPTQKTSLPAGTPAPSSPEYCQEIIPDPVLLFRYSALTFNSHRIHYDREYTTGVEGYPGLIVHGPLLATLIMELLHQHWDSSKLSSFEFKAIRPVFDINRFSVCGNCDGSTSDGGKSIQLWIQDHQGFLCMKATAQLNP